MASGFFSILDDIASLMDDVAYTSQVATRKTAGILGDDLAVNAEKATGFLSTRELPVLWAIIKGSLLNKLIIVPIALLLNAFLPIAIKVILVFGGFYLAYEGVEKVLEYLFHSKKNHEAAKETNEDHAVSEETKIRSAVTTDFVLSVEIVVIALGTVLEKSLPIQILTVAIVSLLSTVGVYGLVALIVRMDDAGLSLVRLSHNKGFLSKVGHLLVKTLPVLIKCIGYVGTIALILVSGGIFIHASDHLHHLFPQVPDLLKEFIIGLVVGLVTLVIMKVGKKLYGIVMKKGEE